MSAPFSQPRNSGDTGHGFSWKPVFVSAIDKTNSVRIATCTDQFGNNMSVRCDIMAAKGVLPEVGEHWMLDHKYGQWVFGAILNGTTRGVEVSTVTDLPETLDTNFNTRPTGDIEITWRTSAKPQSLLMQGQTVNRADYPNLWTFAQNQGLVGPVFGNGNGSTTFMLPDMRGRFVVGTGALGSDSYGIGGVGGAAHHALSTGEMPSHNHPTNSNGFTTVVGDHAHGTSGLTNSQGQHAGHFPATASFVVGSAGGGTTFGLAAWNDTGSFNTPHNHTVIDPTFGGGAHFHQIDASNQNVGGGAAMDLRPPFIAVNWLIWI